MNNYTIHSLYISIEGEMKDISHLSADQIRVLVGVPINLMHNNDQIIKLHDENITGYIDKHSSSTLKPNNISFGYQHY